MVLRIQLARWFVRVGTPYLVSNGGSRVMNQRFPSDVCEGDSLLVRRVRVPSVALFRRLCGLRGGLYDAYNVVCYPIVVFR